jgi:hypothetical protein
MRLQGGPCDGHMDCAHRLPGAAPQAEERMLRTAIRNTCIAFSTMVNIRRGCLVATDQSAHDSDSRHTRRLPSRNASFAQMLRMYIELTRPRVCSHVAH